LSWTPQKNVCGIAKKKSEILSQRRRLCWYILNIREKRGNFFLKEEDSVGIVLCAGR
jgi:hypothetical protein